MGMAKYAEDPQEMDKQLMMQIVRSSISSDEESEVMGSDNGEDEGKGKGGGKDKKSKEKPLFLKKETHEYQSVHRVSLRVLKAAKYCCDIQIKEKNALFMQINNRYKIIQQNSKMLEKEQVDEMNALVQQGTALRQEIEHWLWVRKQLKGDWHCILINSDSINAFVTNVCPRRIFVHKGLFNVTPTEDELAMVININIIIVIIFIIIIIIIIFHFYFHLYYHYHYYCYQVLSHELSHLMLKHSENKATTSAYIAIVQLLLLTLIDPTGLLSFVFDIGIANVGSYVNASNSRECETEADELGLKILSLACYDVIKGPRIFEKFGLLENHAKAGWFATHPSSDERLQKLQLLSRSPEIQANKAKANCQILQRIFFQ